MAGFFNPNTPFDPNSQQDYDYQAQAQKLAMMQALAQRLGKPLDEGKMVSGWYVGPGKGATVASALQQALSGYMSVKGMQSQTELDKSDRAAARSAEAAFNHANDPNNYLERFKSPAPVSPQPNVVDAPQTIPQQAAFSSDLAGPPQARQIPAYMTPEGPMQTVTVSGKREPAVDPDEQVRVLRQAMAADQEAALELLGRTKTGGPLAQALMTRKYAAPDYKNFDVKNADGSTDVMAMDSRTGKVLKLAAGEGGLSPYQQEQIAIERDKMAADERKNQRDLTKVANTIETADGFVNVLADGTMRRVDGAPMGFKQAEEVRKLAEKQGQALAGANTLAAVRAEALQLATPDDDGKTALERASGWTGKLGNKIGRDYGISNGASVARTQIEGVQAKAISAYMAELQASGMNTTQLANTENEVKRAVASRFNIDPDRQSPKEMERQLNLFINYLSDQRKVGLSKAEQSSVGTASTPTAQGPQPRRPDLWTR